MDKLTRKEKEKIIDNLRLRHVRSHATTDFSGFSAGQRDGRNVEIRHGINGTSDIRCLQ